MIAMRKETVVFLPASRIHVCNRMCDEEACVDGKKKKAEEEVLDERMV